MMTMPFVVCLSDLEVLELGQNELKGSVPALPGTLKALYLGFNKFTGSLDDFAAARSDNAMIKMNFESNNLCGDISDELLSNFPELEILNLADNKLKGTLPTLGLAPKLAVLNLNDNKLKCIGDSSNCATLGGRFRCNLAGNNLRCNDDCVDAFANCDVSCGGNSNACSSRRALRLVE